MQSEQIINKLHHQSPKMMFNSRVRTARSNVMSKYTILNTSFNVNTILEVDSSMIEIKFADSIKGISKYELERLVANTIEMAFEQLNPNSFLIGLVNGGKKLSIKFYPHVVDGKLILTLGQYGTREKSDGMSKTTTNNIEVVTNLSASEERVYEEYSEGEDICFTTIKVDKRPWITK